MSSLFLHNRRLRGQRVAAVVGALAVALLAEASSGQDLPRPSFTMRVYDSVDVAPDVLARAREELLEIFKDAGIAVEWLDPTGSSPIGKKTNGPKTFDVRMIVRSHCVQPDPVRSLVIGGTLGFDDAGGAAVACYDQILSVAGNHDLPSADLLALTMAHEIGHLLLPAPGHTRGGIMHSGWTALELRQVNVGALRFTSPQAILMRMKIAGATMVPAR